MEKGNERQSSAARAKLHREIIGDVSMLVCLAIIDVPSVTSVAIHEWAGVALTVIFLVHLARYLDMFRKRKTGSARSTSVKLNLALDIAIFIVIAWVGVSGILISGALLPTFGMFADGYFIWHPLHSAAAKILVALILVHFVAHLDMVIAGLKKAPKGVETQIQSEE